MTEEKILAFLNIDKNKKADKTIMNIAMWFDVAFSLAIILFGLLFEYISINLFNIVFLSLFLAVDIAFVVLICTAKNPVCEINYTLIILSTSTLKLLYGFVVFADGEYVAQGYPIFTWIHVTILTSFLVAAIYVIIKFTIVYRDLREHSLEYASKKAKRDNKFPKWALIFLILPPMFFVRMFRGIWSKLGIGLGVCFWFFMCCWLFMSLIFLPKYIVAKKYKVASWLK